MAHFKKTIIWNVPLLLLFLKIYLLNVYAFSWLKCFVVFAYFNVSFRILWKHFGSNNTEGDQIFRCCLFKPLKQLYKMENLAGISIFLQN